MKDFIQYIFYSGICLSCFWAVYRFLLGGTTFFTFNRIYLLAGLILSFVLPAFVISYDVHIPATVGIQQPVYVNENNQAVGFSLDGWVVAACAYFAVMLLLLIRNLKSYRHIYLLSRNGAVTKTQNYKLIENESVDTPFTVFNRIFFNTGKLSDFEKDLILKHEIVHIDQKHWLDLLCSECALLLQWFNPLVWLYVSSIKENHEFQADSAVLAEGISPARYQAVLINQRFQGPVFSFANSFSLTNKSKRLSMIKKEKSKSWKRAAVLTVLPLLGLFFWASAKPHYILDITNNNIELTNDTIAAADNEFRVEGYKTDSKNVKEDHDAECKSTATFIYVKGKVKRVNNSMVLSCTSDEGGETKEPMSQSKFSKENPLVIVDGVEEKFSILKVISPKDIESVSVIKDETATELYGEKGKNGVILVKTKKAG